MLQRLFNLRNILGVIAIAFVLASIFFSNHLATKIAADEKRKVEQYIEAVNDLNNTNNQDTRLATKIIVENGMDIPLIQTNEKDSIVSSNYDTAVVNNNPTYLRAQLNKIKKINQPIIWNNPLNTAEKNYTYYGESDLLVQIKYFPIVQLVVAILFLIIIVIAILNKSKSTQNQVWAGMAKETAHQLGTPITSLDGWMEILKDNEATQKIALEMSKDVDRLKLVSDRFGKIGSTPKLEETDLILQVESMVQYIKRRATEKVQFTITHHETEPIIAMINPPLFDWVIENLLKNALDAMDGKGAIDIFIKNEIAQIVIDVKDTGKGISKKNMVNVFKPGFTTKQRGWGLGLSLSKRIIDMYHKGSLTVKQSELGKGTTFRIILKK
ncbi:sensor histidine kinase [Ferruginibacter yonginensis]|uniref:histidine kinase n=1 Tax=Ferruginibacter yonginensis TaxID=1310416 RepID=A0ABV8QVV4_9BACT